MLHSSGKNQPSEAAKQHRGKFRSYLSDQAMLDLITFVKKHKVLWNETANFYGSYDHAAIAWNCVLFEMYQKGHDENIEFAAASWDTMWHAFHSGIWRAKDSLFAQRMMFMDGEAGTRPPVIPSYEDILQMYVMRKYIAPKVCTEISTSTETKAKEEKNELKNQVPELLEEVRNLVKEVKNMPKPQSIKEVTAEIFQARDEYKKSKRQQVKKDVGQAVAEFAKKYNQEVQEKKAKKKSMKNTIKLAQDIDKAWTEEKERIAQRTRAFALRKKNAEVKIAKQQEIKKEVFSKVLKSRPETTKIDFLHQTVQCIEDIGRQVEEVAEQKESALRKKEAEVKPAKPRSYPTPEEAARLTRINDYAWKRICEIEAANQLEIKKKAAQEAAENKENLAQASSQAENETTKQSQTKKTVEDVLTQKKELLAQATEATLESVQRLKDAMERNCGEIIRKTEVADPGRGVRSSSAEPSLSVKKVDTGANVSRYVRPSESSTKMYLERAKEAQEKRNKIMASMRRAAHPVLVAEIHDCDASDDQLENQENQAPMVDEFTMKSTREKLNSYKEQLRAWKLNIGNGESIARLVREEDNEITLKDYQENLRKEFPLMKAEPRGEFGQVILSPEDNTKVFGLMMQCQKKEQQEQLVTDPAEKEKLKKEKENTKADISRIRQMNTENGLPGQKAPGVNVTPSEAEKMSRQEYTRKIGDLMQECKEKELQERLATHPLAKKHLRKEIEETKAVISSMMMPPIQRPVAHFVEENVPQAEHLQVGQAEAKFAALVVQSLNKKPEMSEIEKFRQTRQARFKIPQQELYGRAHYAAAVERMKEHVVQLTNTATIWDDNEEKALMIEESKPEEAKVEKIELPKQAAVPEVKGFPSCGGPPHAVLAEQWKQAMLRQLKAAESKTVLKQEPEVQEEPEIPAAKPLSDQEEAEFWKHKETVDDDKNVPEIPAAEPLLSDEEAEFWNEPEIIQGTNEEPEIPSAEHLSQEEEAEFWKEPESTNSIHDGKKEMSRVYNGETFTRLENEIEEESDISSLGPEECDDSTQNDTSSESGDTSEDSDYSTDASMPELEMIDDDEEHEPLLDSSIDDLSLEEVELAYAEDQKTEPSETQDQESTPEINQEEMTVEQSQPVEQVTEFENEDQKSIPETVQVQEEAMVVAHTQTVAQATTTVQITQDDFPSTMLQFLLFIFPAIMTTILILFFEP